MREIKFRGWSGQEMGEMFCVNQEGTSTCLSENNNEFLVVTEELMQYTGLKDRNSKDIYEGDILERDDDNDHLLIVVFKEGMFGFNDIDPMAKELYPDGDLFTVISGWIKYSKIIVVGNIYENPELLENE